MHAKKYTGRGEEQQAAGSGLGSQAHLSQVCVEGVCGVCVGGLVPCACPAPSLTSHLGAPDPALVSQLLAQGYSPRNSKMDITVVSNFSFKIFYTFSLSINFSLQILTLVVPCGTIIGLGCPLNALL
jgi:hypothetical protein